MAGKFSSNEAEELYNWSLEGGADDECGDVGVCGFWACVFKGELEDSGLFLYDYYILIEDDQGFVSAEAFDDAEALEARWQELLEATGGDDELEDDDESAES